MKFGWCLTGSHEGSSTPGSPQTVPQSGTCPGKVRGPYGQILCDCNCHPAQEEDEE